MSSNRFDAFFERCAPISGEATCRALIDQLRERGIGQRLSVARLAADLDRDADEIEEMVALASSCEVGLLLPVDQVRCPHCNARLDRDPLVREGARDGEAECPDCAAPIDNLNNLKIERRYRMAADAQVEAQAQQEAKMAKPNMRAALLCALPVELNAIRAQMERDGHVGRQTAQNGEIYCTGSLSGDEVDWGLYAACSEAGNEAAAASVSNVASEIKPDVLLFVGVAGGIPGAVDLGDVVAATTVYDYEYGKETEDGYHARPLQHQSSYRMRQLAINVSLDPSWQQRIIPSDSERPTLAVHCEPIAAGSKVIAASRSPTANIIEEAAPRAVAVEMEGYGFLLGAWRASESSAIVIRGISDLLNGKQDSDRAGWQARAGAHAAAFAFALLHGFPAPSKDRAKGA